MARLAPGPAPSSALPGFPESPRWSPYTKNLDRISAGDDVPKSVNVLIEIPMCGDPVKYEVDKDSGALFVDRLMSTAMHYPCNYGYIPHTLADDGDPVDVLVITPFPLVPGCVIKCRPL
jgi:inorganic pyrophosphatase